MAFNYIQLQSHTVTINNGTGVFFQPDTNDYSYILTALHNVKGKNEIFDSSPIEISKKVGGKVMQFKIIDTFLNEDYDALLIQIDFVNLDVITIQCDDIFNYEEKLLLFGYPENSRDNENMGRFINCKYDTIYQKIIYITALNRIETEDFKAEHNITGYSGCGIFSDNDGATYLKGIFTGFVDPNAAFNQLVGISIDVFNEIAKKNGIALLLNSTNPYKHLSSFKIEDGNRFHGREKQIEDCINIISDRIQYDRQHFLSIIGGSGYGKSSLAKAGIIYNLKKIDSKIVNSKDWKYIHIDLSVGSNACEMLAESLFNAKIITDSYEYSKIFEISTTHSELHDLMAASGKSFLFIDHFEQIFALLYSNDKSTDSFIKQVNYAMYQPICSIFVLTCIRADFYGKFLDDVRWNLGSLVIDHYPVTGKISSSDLMKIIKKPISLTKKKIDDDLVNRMIDDYFSEPNSLPLLQLTLYNLWDSSEENGIITLYSYESLGGIKGILEFHTKSVLSRLTKSQRYLFDRILIELFRLTNGMRLKRGIMKDELAEILNEDLDTLLNEVSSAHSRLITLKTEQDGKVYISVIHEMLFEWKHIKGLIAENQQLIEKLNLLSADVEKWKNNSKTSSYLYNKARLNEWRALKSKKESMLNLKVDERDFLDKSKKYIRRRELLIAKITMPAVILFLCIFSYFFNDQRHESHKRQYFQNLIAKGNLAIKDQDYFSAFECGRRANALFPNNGEVRSILFNSYYGHTYWINDTMYSMPTMQIISYPKFEIRYFYNYNDKYLFGICNEGLYIYNNNVINLLEQKGYNLAATHLDKNEIVNTIWRKNKNDYTTSFNDFLLVKFHINGKMISRTNIQFNKRESRLFNENLILLNANTLLFCGYSHTMDTLFIEELNIKEYVTKKHVITSLTFLSPNLSGQMTGSLTINNFEPYSKLFFTDDGFKNSNFYEYDLISKKLNPTNASNNFITNLSQLFNGNFGRLEIGSPPNIKDTITGNNLFFYYPNMNLDYNVQITDSLKKVTYPLNNIRTSISTKFVNNNYFYFNKAVVRVDFKANPVKTILPPNQYKNNHKYVGLDKEDLNIINISENGDRICIIHYKIDTSFVVNVIDFEGKLLSKNYFPINMNGQTYYFEKVGTDENYICIVGIDSNDVRRLKLFDSKGKEIIIPSTINLVFSTNPKFIYLYNDKNILIYDIQQDGFVDEFISSNENWIIQADNGYVIGRKHDTHAIVVHPIEYKNKLIDVSDYKNYNPYLGPPILFNNLDKILVPDYSANIYSYVRKYYIKNTSNKIQDSIFVPGYIGVTGSNLIRMNTISSNYEKVSYLYQSNDFSSYMLCHSNSIQTEMSDAHFCVSPDENYIVIYDKNNGPIIAYLNIDSLINRIPLDHATIFN